MGRIQELYDQESRNNEINERVNLNEPVFLNEKPLWKCLGAEFLGSALLMFLGIGCVLKLQEEDVKELDFTGVAMCWGFTVATLVQVGIFLMFSKPTKYYKIMITLLQKIPSHIHILI